MTIFTGYTETNPEKKFSHTHTDTEAGRVSTWVYSEKLFI